MTSQLKPISPTTYEDLLNHLEYLAGLWRRTKDNSIVQRHQTVLAALLELGYREWLDLEALLPEELMLPQYIQVMREAKNKS
jgi:hypothetical protein